GMTRAMERLYMTCAQQRMLYGEPMAAAVSRFVGEVPADLLEDLSAELRAQAARARWQVLPGAARPRRAWARGRWGCGRPPGPGATGGPGRATPNRRARAGEPRAGGALAWPAP